MDWDDILRENTGLGKDRLFLKLKDGDEFVVVFRGRPETVWYDHSTKRTYATPIQGATTRYRTNVVVKMEKELLPKIFESSYTTMRMIAENIKEYGMHTAFKLKRKGSGKDDTLYAVLFKENLSKEAQAKIQAIKMFDLVPKKEVTSPKEQTFDDVAPPSDSDVPPDIDETDDVPF